MASMVKGGASTPAGGLAEFLVSQEDTTQDQDDPTTTYGSDVDGSSHGSMRDQMEEINQLFEIHDTGTKGHLTYDEFNELLEMFCMPPDEVNMALQEVDPQKNRKNTKKRS
eukprot:UN12450